MKKEHLEAPVVDRLLLLLQGCVQVHSDQTRVGLFASLRVSAALQA
jgi:hypothetical protein